MDSNIKTYKNQVTKDVEIASKEYDPFSDRNNEHPTTDNETLTHLLKASLGTGILAMPLAFKMSGLLMGVIAAIITGVIVTHCSYILVKSAHILYKRTKCSTMSFADVAEVAFENGPKPFRKLAKISRIFVIVCLFVTYFGSCSVYTVIIGENTQQLLHHYTNNAYEMDLRLCILIYLIPLLLLSYIPNLKYLAPVSMIANFFMSAGLGITFYYLFRDLPPLTDRVQIRDVTQLPVFLSITIFALEAIGVIMPLENNMKTPQHFGGVLNKGMASVTFIYIVLGFLGYWCYGDETRDSIQLNLPIEETLAQMVKIFITAAVLCSYSLQLYVCIDIVWEANKHRYTNHPTLANYIIRTVIVCSCMTLAICVPKISPLISLIGAFCFSLLGLMAPLIIEMITCWESGFGLNNWMILKNIFCFGFGLIALIFGSNEAIKTILSTYLGE